MWAGGGLARPPGAAPGSPLCGDPRLPLPGDGQGKSWNTILTHHQGSEAGFQSPTLVRHPPVSAGRCLNDPARFGVAGIYSGRSCGCWAWRRGATYSGAPWGLLLVWAGSGELAGNAWGPPRPPDQGLQGAPSPTGSLTLESTSGLGSFCSSTAAGPACRR